MKKYYLYLFFVLSINYVAVSQTGPGGVGNSDGSVGQPRNVLWLTGDSTTLSGTDVAVWRDISGNANDFIPGVTEDSRPADVTGMLANGFSLVEFDNTGTGASRMVRPNFTDMPSSSITALVVFQSNTNAAEAVLSFANNGQSNEYLVFNPQSLQTFLSGTNNVVGTDFDDGNLNIMVNRTQTGGSGQLIVNQNGNADPSPFSGNPGGTIDQGTSNNFTIGGEQDNVDGGYQETQDFDGEIAEIILFDAFINEAQRGVLENYLSSKYNISVANDFYSGDTPGNGDFDFEVAGVGQVDGTNVHSEASSAGFGFANPVLDNGEYLFAGHNNNPVANAVDFDDSDTSPGITSRWSRIWYMDVTGTLDAEITFDFSEGINGENPQNAGNYRLLRDNAGTFEEVTVNGTTIAGDKVVFDVSLSNADDGIYTLGTTDDTASPLEGAPGRTFYSFQSGNWSDPLTWTFDGSATPLRVPLVPTETPLPNDNVVINPGRTVTLDIDNFDIGTGEVEVNGTLAVTDAENINFNDINGSGIITFAGTAANIGNFPAGNTDDFSDPSTGGTAQAVGGGFTINTAYQFGNFQVNLDNPLDVVTLNADLQVNNNLIFTQGIFQFGGASSSDLTVGVDGDVTVEANGVIRTDATNAAARHQFNLSGDLTVQTGGSASFTRRGAVNLTNDNDEGQVDVNFLNTLSNQEIACNGTCNFYRIEIDKGTIDFILDISASAPANFNLFGFANQGHGNVAQLTENDNSLGLVRGTARLKANVEILDLNNTGNYNVSENARIWTQGGRAVKRVGTAIVPYGIVQSSDGGILEALVPSGITTRENASVVVQSGGFIYANQIRTSILGAGNEGGYIQTGGSTIVNGGSGVGSSFTGQGGTQTAYAPFNLTFPGNVFQMSGGVLEIQEPNALGGLYINSDPANISVTGGEVIFGLDNLNGGTQIFRVNSTAPFFDLVLVNPDAVVEGTVNQRTVGIEQITVPDVSPDLAPQPLVILTDFIIGNDVRMDHNGFDVHIGRNFTIQQEGEYFFGVTQADLVSLGETATNNTVLADPRAANTTFFDNEFPAVLTFENLLVDSDATDEQIFSNVVVDKPSGVRVDILAPNKTPGQLGDGNPNTRTNGANALRSVSSFTVESGTVTTSDLYAIRFFGDVTNRDTLGIYTPGVTDIDALLKFRPLDLSIDTDPGAVFGNFRLNNQDAVIALDNDVIIQRLEYRHGRIFIDVHNLRIDELDVDLGGQADRNNCNGCFSFEDMIVMRGNASDGGLTLRIPSDGNNPTDSGDPNFQGDADIDGLDENHFLFPIGYATDPNDIFNTVTRYTPAIVDLATVPSEGFITINVADLPELEILQTTNLSGGNAMDYYWRVRTSGFSGPPVVNELRFFGLDRDINVAPLTDPQLRDITNYVPGGVLDGSPFTRFTDNSANIFNPTNDGTMPSAPPNEGGRVFNDPDTGVDYEISFTNPTGFTPSGGGFELVDANFLAGEAGRFTGSPEIYYSRVTNGFVGNVAAADDWDDPNTWSTDPVLTHDGPAAADFPQVGDIAIIRSFATSGQRMVIIGIENYSGDAGIDVQVAQLILERQNINDPTDDEGNRLMIAQDANVNFGIVDGDATFQPFISSTSTPVFNDTDFGQFVDRADEGAQFLFFGASDGTLSLPPEITVYPNVRFEGGQGNQIDRFFEFPGPSEVRDLLVDGNASFRVTADILITDDFQIGAFNAGFIEFSGVGGANTITVEDDFITRSDGDNQVYVNNSATGLEHRLIVKGDIDFANNTVENNPVAATGANSGFDLFTNNTGGDNVILELAPADGVSSSWTNADNVIPDLYRVVMNGDSSSSSFTINTDFDLNGPANGSQKALELQLGTLTLNNNNIDIDLNTGGDNFLIPVNTELDVDAGTVNVSGDDTGIGLNGILTIRGGTVDLSSGPGNGNNYIQYGSGQPTINVTSGNLLVGTQVRRNLSSEVGGVLNYSQTGGTALFGITDPACNCYEENRGIFEITNGVGSFNINSLANFTLRNQNGINPEVAALILNANASISNVNGIINVFDNLTASNQLDFGINSTLPIIREINISSGSFPTRAEIVTNPLEISNNLMIEANATLDANSIDLIYNTQRSGTATFTNDGIYLGNSNTTRFQAIGRTINIVGSGTYNFGNVFKTSPSNLDVLVDINILGDLTVSQGNIRDIGSTISLEGNLQMLSTTNHISVNSLGEGILLNGNNLQLISSNSGFINSLGRVTVNNPSDVRIESGFTFIISEELRLENGRLDIQSNELRIDTEADIIPVNPFSVNNMIRTSSIGGGVRRFFNAINSNTPLEYPVGQLTSGGFIFTPALVSVDQVDAGDVTVRAVNAEDLTNPLIIDDADDFNCGSGPANQEIVDFNNALQYYWLITASNSADNFTGAIQLTYDDSDVLFDSPLFTINNYSAAYLQTTSDTWTRNFLQQSFDEASNQINIDQSIFSGVENTFYSGFYTAGVNVCNDNSLMDNGAIPNEVQELLTNGIGGGLFDQSPTYVGNPSFPAGVPLGASIVVQTGDELTINTDNVNLLRVEIQDGAILDIDPSVSNVFLGLVSGTGTIRVSNELLPAGFYSDFFVCPSGGAIEYAGTTDYSVLNAINQVRSVIISGSGTRALPNAFVEVCENIIIDGPMVDKDFSTDLLINEDFILRNGSFNSNPSGATEILILDSLLLENGSFQLNNNTDIQIGGNLERQAPASFNTVNSTITLNGTSSQTIAGSFLNADGNSFGDLIINNEGITGDDLINLVDAGNNDVEVESITFTRGVLETDLNNLLVIRTAGGVNGNPADSSYVDGPVQRSSIVASGSFDFPIGKERIFRPAIVSSVSTGGVAWTAEYFTTNLNGTTDFDMGTGTFGTIVAVSNEMWRIESSSSPVNAQVSLTYGPESDPGDPTLLNAMLWDDDPALPGTGTPNQWIAVGEEVTISGQGGTVATSGVDLIEFSIRDFTLGTEDPGALPVELFNFDAKRVNDEIEVIWSTASEVNNDYFVVERAADPRDEFFVISDTIQGAGNSSSIIEYKFVDEFPLAGVNYYRLRQVDFDGTKTNSGVVSVVFNLDRRGIEFSVYPNPMNFDLNNKIFLDLSGLQSEQDVPVSFYSLEGFKLFDVSLKAGQNGSLPEGGDYLELNRQIPSGIYVIVVMIDSNKPLIKRIIIN
ncbi:MAG: hypothetical protein AAF363_13495 [Bacteroidota bacterium]